MIKNLVKKLIGDKKDTTLLHELYEKPKTERGKDVPTFQVYKEGIYSQADLLFLPSNFGYKYLLVVVDNHSKKCDAEPIKQKDSDTVVKAFKKIYARGILLMPKVITTDAGSEFKSSCNTYFEDNKIHHISAPTNRHRMVGLVERKNQIIGTVLNQIMAQEELDTNKVNRNWVKYLPELIKEINLSLPKPLTEEKYDDPIFTQGNRNIIPEGTKVRTKLDAPEDIATGKRLGGKFRDGDIKWSRDVKEVKQIILQPSQPPLYLVDGVKHAFTSQQLQRTNGNSVIKEKEIRQKPIPTQKLNNKPKLNRLLNEIADHNNKPNKLTPEQMLALFV